MPIVEYCIATCDKCPTRIPGRFESVVDAERAAERAGWWWGGHVTYDALLCLDCRAAWTPVKTVYGVRYEPMAEGAVAETPVPDNSGRSLRYADLVLDLGFREISRGGHATRLTRTEFGLLELLMRHAGEPVKRADILREVWGYEFTPKTDSLEVYVGYLRRKTEARGGSRLVQTVRGVGYALRETP